MKKSIYFIMIALLFSLSSCEDYLDRKNLDTFAEDNFWTSEGNMRIFCQGAYTTYFYGYGSGYSWGNFYTGGGWADEYSSASIWTINTSTSSSSWSFTNVRRANIIIDRADDLPASDEAIAHWKGVGYFFRAMEYARLASSFGAVPWYGREIFPAEKDTIYKDRDPLEYVATKIMNDYQFAADNVRENDGTLQINRNIVLAFMSRDMLYFGTYLKYHGGDITVANELLTKAKWAANEVILSGTYSVSDDYRAIFASLDLSTNKEVILYRQYETAKATHCLVSYNNTEAQTGTTLKMVETYLAGDGLPIKQSPVYDYSSDNGLRYFNNQIQSRDPRLYATLVDSVRIRTIHSIYSTTGIACLKFLPYAATTTDLIYQGSTNTTDAPVIRYGEVLLNYAEAAAELGQFDQAAADLTINKLRNRNIKMKPTDTAILPKLPAMTISGTDVLANGVVINDPDRDPSVSPILWEIRRERCVELIYEGFRRDDLRRWGKFSYLKTAENGTGPTTMGKGACINLFDYTLAQRKKLASTVKLYFPTAGDSTHVFIYNLYDVNQRRDWVEGEEFYERQYLSSVPLNQITLYKNAGFTLTQNYGWDSE